MFLLYNFLLTLLAPIWVPWMLWRANRRAEKPNWKERTGDYALTADKDATRIWVHAVSVGEVMAALPILRALRDMEPGFQIVLSVTTSSGHRTATEHAGGLYDHLVYFPIDVARFQLAAMVRVKPRAVAIMETELWLNFLWAAKAVEAKTLLINGRISDRSFPRARRLAFFYQTLLEHVDQALMQTDLDAERIRQLGARNVRVFGNCKFDQAAEGLEADPAFWRAELGIPEGNRVVVVGSTRGEEEERFVLDALKSLDLSGVSIVHAPRHLERVPELAKLVEPLFGKPAYRSRGETGRYLILDTYGELAKVYSAADVVVVGGGFADLGGQNILQPLALGKPVVHGPHMQNFAEAAARSAELGCTLTAATPSELANALGNLLSDPARRESMGRAAFEFVRSSLGSSRRYAEAICEAAWASRPKAG